MNNPNQDQEVNMTTSVQQNPQMVQTGETSEQSPQYVQPMYHVEAVDAKQVPDSLPPPVVQI
eukprot:snap_masked-scaffold_7-processed-gene-19.46-mRNA-1 protein AED:1.00 eAED:1.00 QI:0/-1/0/0/-1/1/1/0/61